MVESPPCNIIEGILNKGKEPRPENFDENLFELSQRLEINEHLKSCKDAKCQELRIDRINKGLYQ